jgi:hypothetical protein
LIRTILVAAGAFVVLVGSTSLQAQAPPLAFDQSVYITCKEAHAMPPESRKALAIFLADHSARNRGVTIPGDERGAQIGFLVRGGCTLSPDAYLFAVIDRAVVAELSNLPKR